VSDSLLYRNCGLLEGIFTVPGGWTRTEWVTSSSQAYWLRIILHKLLLISCPYNISETVWAILQTVQSCSQWGNRMNWRWVQSFHGYGQHLNEFTFLPVEVTTMEVTTLPESYTSLHAGAQGVPFHMCLLVLPLKRAVSCHLHLNWFSEIEIESQDWTDVYEGISNPASQVSLESRSD